MNKQDIYGHYFRKVEERPELPAPGYTPQIRRGYEKGERTDNCPLSGLGKVVFNLLGIKIPNTKPQPIRNR